MGKPPFCPKLGVKVYPLGILFQVPASEFFLYRCEYPLSDLFLHCRMTGSADLMAGREGEGLLPGSLATGRPPAWGLNAVSAVGSHSLASLIAQVPWAEGGLSAM